MYNLDRYQISNILIELLHEKIHIEEKVELPAFADQGISQEIRQRDRVLIIPQSMPESSDASQLNW